MSLTKVIGFAAASFLLFAIGRLISINIDQTLGPHWECDPSTIDLGDVVVGTAAHCAFVIRNTGSERLLITNITSTCQCTVADLASRIVPPGASTEIDVVFSPKSVGIRTQSVTVEANDPYKPVRILKLRARAIAAMSPIFRKLR